MFPERRCKRLILNSGHAGCHLLSAVELIYTKPREMIQLKAPRHLHSPLYGCCHPVVIENASHCLHKNSNGTKHRWFKENERNIEVKDIQQPANVIMNGTCYGAKLLDFFLPCLKVSSSSSQRKTVGTNGVSFTAPRARWRTKCPPRPPKPVEIFSGLPPAPNVQPWSSEDDGPSEHSNTVSWVQPKTFCNYACAGNQPCKNVRRWQALQAAASL